MYYWRYIKEVSLAKLDLSEDEAQEQNLLDRFKFYANEAMTQICSAVKPKNTYEKFTVTESFSIMEMPADFIRFGDDVNYFKADTSKNNLQGYAEEINEHFNKLYNDYDPLLMNNFRETSDDEFVYYGYNQLLFKKPGIYLISYDARWYTFDEDLTDETLLNVPADILDCLPSYIASQCFKVDDEVKSSIFRNEFEMAVARIDNTNYKNSKTIKLGGDWD